MATLISTDQKLLFKKSFGFGFSIMGGFFILLGFLYSFLFEIPLLMILAGFGIILLLLGIYFLYSTRYVNMAELSQRIQVQRVNQIHNQMLQYSAGGNLQEMSPQLNCPKCRRVIPGDARLCPYCGEPQTIIFPPNQPLVQAYPVNCPTCGMKLEANSNVCSYCGMEIKLRKN